MARTRPRSRPIAATWGMTMDETSSTALYVAIGIGLAVVLIYAGRQFMAGVMEAKREHDARARSDAEHAPTTAPSAAEQVVRRRRW